MKQATLRFRTYAGVIGIRRETHLRKKILRTIMVALLVLSLAYAFFLGSMVLNIIERKHLEADARNITNQIGELELVYFAKSNEIDLALSGAMGFRETKQNFATRQPLGSLKIANNEI